MSEELQQLVDIVHQLASAGLIQARKLEELQRRVQQLEYERMTNAVGTRYGSLNTEA